MSEWSELWPGGPRFCQAEHFALGTDSILLADFVRAPGAKRGVDLGCGSGILSLLLLHKTEKLRMTGLELDDAAAAVARDNLARNALSSRGEIVRGDIRNVRSLFRAGSFDLAVSNPPYFAEGRGARSPDPARAAARSEASCSLEELCAAAAFLLSTAGRFCLVHRPERLSEVFVTLSAHALEPKRLRLVCAREGRSPSLALIEARRGGAPGLIIEPTLLLRDSSGGESAELRRIYHRGGAGAAK